MSPLREDPQQAQDTTTQQLDAVLDTAQAAAEPLAALRPAQRAQLLRDIAGALEAERDKLVTLADEETQLGKVRLTGELARTTGQLRMFAAVIEEGHYLEAVIDHADPDASPTARPDVRRILVPLGPTVVFAASNFPFAFSVAGGDTASALAAGCPVVLKAHPGHPRLSEAVGDLAREAIAAASAPEGTLSLIHGLEAGRAAVLDPRIAAGAFTGSITAGRSLFDLANSRHEPIPFYGELGSLNPVVVTPAAARDRTAEIAQGYIQSLSLGMGQFCTKPGLLFLPKGHGLREHLIAAMRSIQPAPLLNNRIAAAYRTEARRLADHDAVSTVNVIDSQRHDLPSVTLLATTTDALRRHGHELLKECFGPCSLIVEYNDPAELPEIVANMAGNLTATVHAEDSDRATVGPLLQSLTERAGRVIWNGWPTGVAVTWSMHHGGPYPATTSALHTSVGATAIRRFLRPVCYQSMPQDLLPEGLQETNPLGIPRRVDGVLADVR